MILSDRDIRKEIEAGRLEIDPFDPSMIQPSSIDLHVDNAFRVFANSRYPYIDVRQRMDDLTELVEVKEDDPFILHPGEFVLAVTLGPSFTNVVVAIGAILWARYARVIHGEVLALMERDFIAQARLTGCSAGRIILVHLLPNTLHTLIVLVSLQIGYVIIVEASLSFLGAGIPPPAPAWGSMIAEGRDYITSAWWVSFFPGLAILLVVLAFNLLGDWLRDVLDPKLRQP